MSADRSPPYCPACGLQTPCTTCGKPRLGVVQNIEEAGDAIAQAMAEIEKARAGLDRVTAEKAELQKALSVVAEHLAISMRLENEAEARAEKLKVTIENLRASHEFPRVEDVVEFARLRGLIKEAEKTGYNTAVCPWCSHADRPTSYREGWKHTATCPAFTADGAVR